MNATMDSPDKGGSDVNKVDDLARETARRISGQSTRALMHGSEGAGFRLDSTAQTYIAQHGEHSPEKKKKKELEELAKAARALDKWLDDLDELIETLREEAQEHYRKAQELYNEAEDLDELVEAMQEGYPLTEKQQQKLDEMRKKHPEANDDMLLIIMQQDLIDMRGLAEAEYRAGEAKDRLAEKLTVIGQEAENGTITHDEAKRKVREEIKNSDVVKADVALNNVIANPQDSASKDKIEVFSGDLHDSRTAEATGEQTVAVVRQEVKAFY